MSQANDEGTISGPLITFIIGIAIAILGAMVGTDSPDAGIGLAYLGAGVSSLAVIIEIFVIGSSVRRILKALPQPSTIEQTATKE